MKQLTRKTGLKLTCIALAAALSSGAAFAAADTPGAAAGQGTNEAAFAVTARPETVGISYTKNETVYVNLDPSGKPYEQTVVDWLHSDTPGAAIGDRTTLGDIENVKGDEEPQRSGNNLTWNLSGNDLYYRGKTDGKLPIDVSITYRLDGKVLPPQEIAGRSGKLEINLKFRNNLRRTALIGGKSTDLYVPVTAAVAMTLPDATFSNVTVSDGTIQTDGNNRAVAIVAMPGLEESLSLEDYDIPGFEDIDFPEEFTVTADVSEFEMGPIAVVMTTKIPELDRLDMASDIDDMRLDLKDLQGAQNDLTAWDPAYRTRSLFTDPFHTAGARVLVDDIFKFYDQDVAILDILPKYITDENIALYDRIDADMEDVEIDDFLESESIDNLVDRLNAQNIDKIRQLLDDYDTIKKLNTNDLDDLLDEMEYLLDEAEHNGEVINTYKVLMEYADDMMSMMKALDNPELEKLLEPSVLFPAIEYVVGQQVDQTIAGMEIAPGAGIRYPNYGDLDSAINSLRLKQEISSDEEAALSAALHVAIASNPSQVSQLQGLLSFIGSYNSTLQALSIQPVTLNSNKLTCGSSSLENSAAEDTPDPVPDSILLPEPDSKDEEGGDPETELGAIENDRDSDTVGLYDAAADPAAAFETARQGLISAAREVKTAMDTTRGPAVSQKTRELEAQLGDLLSGMKSIKAGIEKDLGGAGIARKRIELALDFTDKMIPRLQKMLDLTNKLANKVYGHRFDDGEGVEALKSELKSMLDDLDDNEGNITALRDVLDEYDAGQFDSLRRKWPDIKRDIRDVRPILEDLRDELDDPALDRSLHASPETTDVLLQMKNDLFEQREISEILRDSLADDKVQVATRMFGTFDRLQAEGSVDKYVGQVDDADLLLERKDAIVELSNRYRIYTDAAESADTEVKFIMKTDEIEKPEPVAEEVPKTQEKQSFIDWAKGLLGKLTGKK